MIIIEPLTETEAQRLNAEQKSAFFAIPTAFTLGALLFNFLFNWLFDVPWSIFWWISGGMFTLFFLVYLVTGKSVLLQGQELKAIRRATVTAAVYKGNNPGFNRLNAGQFVAITLAHEELPEHHPERHTFTVYRTLGMPYFKQDSSLKYRCKELVGKEVEIEYLILSGAVLAFRELTPGSPV